MQCKIRWNSISISTVCKLYPYHSISTSIHWWIDLNSWVLLLTHHFKRFSIFSKPVEPKAWWKMQWMKSQRWSSHIRTTIQTYQEIEFAVQCASRFVKLTTPLASYIPKSILLLRFIRMWSGFSNRGDCEELASLLSYIPSSLHWWLAHAKCFLSTLPKQFLTWIKYESEIWFLPITSDVTRLKNTDDDKILDQNTSNWLCKRWWRRIDDERLYIFFSNVSHVVMSNKLQDEVKKTW